MKQKLRIRSRNKLTSLDKNKERTPDVASIVIVHKKIIHPIMPIIILLLIFISIAINSQYAHSQVPSPQNVAGRVFNSDGSGAPNGIPVIINNTNISQLFFTQVFAPPIPSLAGSYSLTINGSLGDLLEGWAYNATHYGFNSNTITSGTTQINITINISRPSETNVTITYPDNNALFDSGMSFNATINVSVLGSQGLDCNVTISISNESVLEYASGTNSTNHIGTMNLGQIYQTSFEFIAAADGTSNITAIGACSTDGINFAGLNITTKTNITVSDDVPPNINVIFPENNTLNKSNNTVAFIYSAFDYSNINNCSLIINGTLTDTNYNLVNDETYQLNATLNNGNYEWKIGCYDSNNNYGETGTYNITINIRLPEINIYSLPGNIQLSPGSPVQVQCNASVIDMNGASDITDFNMSFRYYDDYSHIQDNNTNYFNSSCEVLGSGDYEINYSCSFYVYYYANNGSWICNATAVDEDFHTSSNLTNTIIDALYALNVSENVIDYGLIPPNEYSNDKTINITNLGNMPINVSVLGYGGNDPVTGEGFAFTCTSGENITVDNQRFSYQESTDFMSKQQISYEQQNIGFTIPKQTAADIRSENSTYWQIYVPTVGITFCTGTVRFIVSAS